MEIIKFWYVFFFFGSLIFQLFYQNQLFKTYFCCNLLQDSTSGDQGILKVTLEGVSVVFVDRKVKLILILLTKVD